jgi:hypothetical protein
MHAGNFEDANGYYVACVTCCGSWDGLVSSVGGAARVELGGWSAKCVGAGGQAYIQAGSGYAGMGIQVWVYRVSMGGYRLQGGMGMVVVVYVVVGMVGVRCVEGGASGAVCRWYACVQGLAAYKGCRRVCAWHMWSYTLYLPGAIL